MLHDVLRATVISKLTYCAPLWSGACSAADHASWNHSSADARDLATVVTTRRHTVNLSVMLTKVFQRRHQRQWTPSTITLTWPFRHSIQSPWKKYTINKTLISKTIHINDDDFLIRMLYKDLYWTVYQHLFYTQSLAWVACDNSLINEYVIMMTATFKLETNHN